jgi:hypothetical protein
MLDKRNVYFIDSRGNYRLLATGVEEYKVYTIIKKFLAEHKFKSYYIRSWNTVEGREYDVGSHSEFFLWGFKNED